MQDAPHVMSNGAGSRACLVALCAAAMAFGARAETQAGATPGVAAPDVAVPGDHIVTRVSAEVLARPRDTAMPSRLQTAERVVPGDILIYTVEVRNLGEYAVESAVVVQKIPNHTVYVADSAVGPGVEVDYSTDGGRTFGNAQKPNSTAAYTHIRWRLHNRLKPASVAFVRFRAQVK